MSEKSDPHINQKIDPTDLDPTGLDPTGLDFINFNPSYFKPAKPTCHLWLEAKWDLEKKGISHQKVTISQENQLSKGDNKGHKRWVFERVQ